MRWRVGKDGMKCNCEEWWLLDGDNFWEWRRLVMDQMENKWGLNGEKLKDLCGPEWFKVFKQMKET